MADKVRLAPVGLGRWARVLARGAQRGDVIELASCFSRSEDKRAAFQAEYGVPRSAATYEELLADRRDRGSDHHDPERHAPRSHQPGARRGQGCLHRQADRPDARGRRGDQAGRRANRGSVRRGSQRTRLSGNRVMKQWIDDGTLGGVSMIEANFSNERGLELTPRPGAGTCRRPRRAADPARASITPTTSSTCSGRCRQCPRTPRKLFTDAEVPDATMAILEFESGALGYLGCGWASPGIYQIRAQGTKQNLMYDLDFTHWDEAHEADAYSTLVSQAYGQQERTPVDLPRTDMFREQLEEFALAARGEATVEVQVDDAIRALAIVHTAIESNRQGGKAVEVKPFLDSVGVT